MCINIYNPIGVSKNDHTQPAVLQINLLVNQLQCRGIDIHLIDFDASNPEKYTQERNVEQVLLTDGPDAFPVTCVDGEIFQKNNYPDYAQLLDWSAASEQRQSTT